MRVVNNKAFWRCSSCGSEFEPTPSELHRHGLEHKIEVIILRRTKLTLEEIREKITRGIRDEREAQRVLNAIKIGSKIRK